MTNENPFENWTYVPASSDGREFNSKKKVFDARGHCERKGTTFVREDFFFYNEGIISGTRKDSEYLEEGLLVIEEERNGLASLLIPGIVRDNKIYPLPSNERLNVLGYLNRDIIDDGGKKMAGVFWNIELGVTGLSYRLSSTGAV